MKKIFSRLRGFYSGFTRTVMAGLGTLLLAAAVFTLKSDRRYTPPPPKPFPYDTVGVAKLRADFGKTSLGRDMLKVADDYGVVICYDTLLLNDPHVMGVNLGFANKLIIKRGQNEIKQVITLAHELRHAWQYNVLKYYKYTSAAISPQENWAIERTIEADAYAFSAYYWADRMIKTGETWAKGDTAISTLDLQFNQASHIASDIKSGRFNLVDYRNEILQPCYATLNDRNYNSAHLNSSRSTFDAYAADLNKADSLFHAGKGLEAQKISDRIAQQMSQDAPSTAEVEKHIRRYGGVSLDTAVTTAFQDKQISRYTLLKVYPQSYSDEQQQMAHADEVNKGLTAADSLFKKVFVQAQKYSQKARRGQIRKPL